MDFEETLKQLADKAQQGRIENTYRPTEEEQKKSALLMNNWGYEPLNIELFKRLCGYFTGYRLGKYKKGIAMFGPNGIGKTYFLKRILRSPLYRCKDLASVYRDDETKFRDLVSRQAGQYDIIPEGHLELSIDEVGEENPVNDFGNKSEVFAEILQIRHSVFEKYNGITHFSSNLTRDEFNERYGARCLSRINQMCFSIDLTGDDLR